MMINVKNELLKKYNKPAPRYTSYPTVPFWRNSPTTQNWIDSVSSSLDANYGVDLYIHIPFCAKLCWYCGCNRIISRDLDKGDLYIDYLIKEWNLYKKEVPMLKINSIHFGGGTPNFLKPEILDKLLAHLSEDFNPGILGSMEVDPRTVEEKHLLVLDQYGFTRLSMGIQDFDPKVQSSINRIQSYELVSNLIDKTKAYGFNSINFDLIYGLPNQTEQSIEDTIEKVKKLKPEMIAFYSYAHLPTSLKNQKLINEDELPKGDEKRKLYEKGRNLLFQAGYLEIGLDHFTLKDSYLGRAFEQKRLKRNFMGYTDKKSNCLLGLGVSSISNNNDYFIQSEKEIKDYYSSIDQNLLPTFKGHTLTVDDQIVSDIIQELMCNLTVNIQGLQSASYFKQVEAELEALEIDGLIKYENYSVDVTSLGQVYLRNIALVFDSYLRERESSVIFSQSI